MYQFPWVVRLSDVGDGDFTFLGFKQDKTLIAGLVGLFQSLAVEKPTNLLTHTKI
ncbi:MAG: hypothetical protein HXS54_15125 [Theionarchaea archaeon]|nr:hypothetical protein [Theionarchaea archaeon]